MVGSGTELLERKRFVGDWLCSIYAKGWGDDGEEV